MKKTIQLICSLVLLLSLSTVTLANDNMQLHGINNNDFITTEVIRPDINEHFNSFTVYGDDYKPHKSSTVYDQFKLFFAYMPSRSSVIEKYSHSEYSIAGYRLIGTRVGPIEQQRCYDSRAKGETYTSSSTTTINAYLKISTTVKSGIKFLVEGKLEAEAGGSYEYKWSSSYTLSGPAENSIYNTRLFYHAIDYDKYSFDIKETRYTNIYTAGGTYITQKSDTIYIPKFTVKRPIGISYSEDVKY